MTWRRKRWRPRSACRQSEFSRRWWRAAIGTEFAWRSFLAAAAGERKIQLVPVKELQGLTGYIRGGVTALAAKRDFPVYVDETIELFDLVSISAGVRGLQILIAPADYLRATKGQITALADAKRSAP